MSLNLSTKLIFLGSLSRISLSKLNDVQAGLINHIYLFSTLIWILPAVEQMLYDRYLFGLQMREWGPYETLTPTEKLTVWLRRLRGGLVGEQMSYGVVYLTSVMVVVCLIIVLYFQPPRCICTSFVLGGYCRVKVH